MEPNRGKIMGSEGVFMGSDYGKSKCYGLDYESNISVRINVTNTP
jgi:hypothetical protein